MVAKYPTNLDGYIYQLPVEASLNKKGLVSVRHGDKSIEITAKKFKVGISEYEQEVFNRGYAEFPHLYSLDCHRGWFWRTYKLQEEEKRNAKD